MLLQVTAELSMFRQSSGLSWPWCSWVPSWLCLLSWTPLCGAGITQGSAPSWTFGHCPQHCKAAPGTDSTQARFAATDGNAKCMSQSMFSSLEHLGNLKKIHFGQLSCSVFALQVRRWNSCDSFTQAWLWAKAAVWGSGLGGCDKINSAPSGLIQGFLSPGKPAWLLSLLPQQRLNKQSCTMVVPKPRTNTSTHTHLSLQGHSSSSPGLPSSSQLHPLSCGGSNQPLNPPTALGSPELALLYYSP